MNLATVKEQLLTLRLICYRAIDRVVVDEAVEVINTMLADLGGSVQTTAKSGERRQFTERQFEGLKDAVLRLARSCDEGKAKRAFFEVVYLIQVMLEDLRDNDYDEY